MAQQRPDPTDRKNAVAPLAPWHGGEAPTGAVLEEYLRAQATEFLRALRLHRETGAGGTAPAARTGAAARAGAAARTGGPAPRTGAATRTPASSRPSAAGRTAAAGRSGAKAPEPSPEDPRDATLALRRSARRITATLHTFQPFLDGAWSERIRGELAWLSGTLALEQACTGRLTRLVTAMNRLSGAAALPRQADAVGPLATDRPALALGSLTVGAAKAAALLERQLTLARTRAHSTALQALGSSRFHAVADAVALLASEVPLAPTAATTDLRPQAAAAEDRLATAVAALPLATAGHAYNAQALVHGLSPDLAAPHPQDAPWHQVRLLLRLHRYACEVLHTGSSGDPVSDDARLLAAAHALDNHRDASEAAAAVAAAARTPRIAPATAYALGVLHADQRYEVEAARFAFHTCWQPEVPGESARRGEPGEPGEPGDPVRPGRPGQPVQGASRKSPKEALRP